MKLNPHLVEGVFLARLNRFAALVSVRGQETLAHVANSGRLLESFQPGNRVLLAPVRQDAERKTPYDLALVDLGHTLVSADARLPNMLVHEAIAKGRLPEFQGYREILREKTLEDSRLDILLLDNDRRCYLEVKSVTLVDRGVGLFPDAPTTRGLRHVHTLARAVQHGWRAAVVFVVQRQDAVAFAPHDAADPAFGLALRQAHAAGTEVYAYNCTVTQEEVQLGSRLPVFLEPSGKGANP